MLLQNQRLMAAQPLRQLAGANGMDRAMWGRTSRLNIFAGVGVSDRKFAVPVGYLAPVAWVLPRTAGGMSSTNEIIGSASMTGDGALGRNIEAALAGEASLSAIGALIVSAVAALSGTGALSAAGVGALQLAASLTASGEIVGAISALAHAVGVLSGAATVTTTIRATGTLGAAIEIGAQEGLTATAVAAEVLDQQLVETGLTVRQALRLVAAALAGKISGAEGTTITIRNAVADDADRIVATVDSNGNRTAITYELE